MKLDELGLDRIKTFGQPYHGLWKAGSIALPNGTSKTCPAPAGGGVVLLRVPGQPAVSRTAPELAADATAGREWRNYGLISGGRYGASDPVYGPPGTASVIFIDAANVTWLMHITWGSANTYMVVKLRRFGHFEAPWAETAWSSTINVTVYPDFRYALASYSLLTVCQNTTGREFVLGAVSIGAMYDYCYAMLKVEVAGTVDLSAAGFGLVFGGTILGGPGFEAGTKTEHAEVSGDLVVVETQIFNEWYGGGPTGIVVTRTITTTNGGTPVISDSPKPAIYSGGFSYILAADPTYSASSTRISQNSVTRDAECRVWAVFEEDALKLLVVRMHAVGGGYDLSFHHHDFHPDTHVARWSVAGTVENSCTIEWELDGVVVLSKSASDIESVAPTLFGYSAPGIDFSHTTTSFGISISMMMDLLNSVQNFETPHVFDAPIVVPLMVSGVSWATPCLACVSRIGHGGTYTWTTQKVIAPSGAFQATSIPIASLSASWQPATDQLAVDSVPICWF